MMKVELPAIRSLANLRDAKNLSMEALLDHLSKLIPFFVKKQVRHKVVDIPSVRTIRFYHRAGLIDPALRSGRQAAYSYRHVLQILVVKLLQTENLNLKKIAEITTLSRNEALQDILLNSRQGFDMFGGAPGLVRTDAGDLSSWPGGRYELPLAPDESIWKKIRVAEGLELHVGESFNISSDECTFVSRRILDILEALAVDSTRRTMADNAYLAADDSRLSSGGHRKAFPSGTVIALVTEGGLVPVGNPDKLESARAGRFLKYSIAGVSALAGGQFESVDRGWDNRHVNENPNRLLPLDVISELEKDQTSLTVHKYFYTTTGVATSIEDSQRMGRSIAKELLDHHISAVILTST
jgi:DNA-binding transcriptional MerR regulator